MTNLINEDKMKMIWIIIVGIEMLRYELNLSF